MAVQLTPHQQAALEAEGDVIVRAAAGSGKTRVLTERIVRAVVEHDIPLAAIVAVTFTEKAAQEIRERVAQRLHELGRDEQVAQLEHAAIGTIHGLCSRLLRDFGTAVGVDPGFGILDAAQVAYLRQRAFDDALERAAGDAEWADVRVRYGDGRLRDYVLAAANAADQRIDRAVRFDAAAAGVPERDAQLLQRCLDAYVASYTAAKRAAGGLDFSDLEHLALALFADEAVRTQVRYRVLRLLVDEFQDTNALQCALLGHVGAGCTFMVGDEWQSIYRFRAADVDVFRARAGELAEAGAAIGMRDNFRSQPAVLDVVNHVFDEAFGEGYEPVVAGLPADPVVAAEPACDVLVVPANDVADPRDVEARAVAAQIATLIEQGAEPSDIAILLARQTHAAAFEQALEAWNIPAIRSTSRGYYGHAQVRDITSLLRWVGNPRDDAAALAVLRAPYIGLGWADVLRLRGQGTSLAEAVSNDHDPRCERAHLLREELVAIAAGGSLVDVVEFAVHGTGYAHMVVGMRDGRRRYANLRKLIELAASAQRLGIDDVTRFLELVDAQRDQAVEGEANIADEALGSVRIMTVHASKGLEFPYVFVCDTANRGRTVGPQLLAEADGTLGWMVPDEDGLEFAPAANLVALREAEAHAEAAEERRLFYVALTRAERRLWITGTYKLKKDGALAATGPIGWLADAIGVSLPTLDGSWQHPNLSLRVRQVLHAPRPTADIRDAARPISVLPPAVAIAPLPAAAPANEDLRPLALREQREQLADADTRRRIGRLVHQHLARELADTASSFSDDIAARLPDDIAEQVAAVVASPTFTALHEAGARPEVPYCVVEGERTVAGRIDALARSADGRDWWIVDFKQTLPADPAEAWALHGEQLERYAAAAAAGNAATVRLTLLAIDRPTEPHEWRCSIDGAAIGVPALTH